MNNEIQTLDEQTFDLVAGGVVERPDGGGCTGPFAPKDPQQPLMSDLLGSTQ